MLLRWCSMWRITLMGLSAPLCTSNADGITTAVLLQHHLRPVLRRKRRHLVVLNPIILHDNARSHTAAAVTTPCAASNRKFWNIHLTHPISPCDYYLFVKVKDPLARDPVENRWTYPCFRAVNTGHQQRWTRWWCKTPSKHLLKVIMGRLYWRYINAEPPVNKAMSAILNCCHYILSNLCKIKGNSI